MKRVTQNRLYHLLPVVFWLLTVVGTLLPIIPNLLPFTFHFSPSYYWGYLVTAFVLFCIVIIGRIQRHSDSIEECFQVALLLGIASYWLPTVLFLMIPIWVYLFYQNLFSFRAALATFIGFAVVAVWAALLVLLGCIANPWADFFAKENAWGWIPTGAILVAWLLSTITRLVLRPR